MLRLLLADYIENFIDLVFFVGVFDGLAAEGEAVVPGEQKVLAQKVLLRHHRVFVLDNHKQLP